jgi:CheY-like chemotaxis protein
MHAKSDATTGRRILIVDDDQDFLTQQKLRLESAGCRVECAEGALRARERLAGPEPDLAIIDLMMEDMDGGIVLARELKAHWPTLPIIMVTGVTRETGLVFDTDSEEARRWLKVDRILAKPVRWEQLRGEVELLLAGRAAAGRRP